MRKISIKQLAFSISAATAALFGGVLKLLVRTYQLLIAPLLGHNCRYLPSCSAYAMEALDRHGPVSGSWLAAKRVCRCHPWGGHGLDPVPPRSGTQHDTLHPHATPSAHGSVPASSKG